MRLQSLTGRTMPSAGHDDRWTVQGDPTEGALVVAARKAGLEAEALSGRFERIGEVPFSSERKLMSTVHTMRRDRNACWCLPRALPMYSCPVLRGTRWREHKTPHG